MLYPYIKFHFQFQVTSTMEVMNISIEVLQRSILLMSHVVQSATVQ